MISLDGERLFHISSQANRSPYPLLQPGEVLTVGSTTNPFFRFFDADRRTFPVTEANGTVNNVPAMRFLGEVRDGTINPTDLPGDAYVIAVSTDNATQLPGNSISRARAIAAEHLVEEGYGGDTNAEPSPFDRRFFS